jgi:hypothetical protein
VLQAFELLRARMNGFWLLPLVWLGIFGSVLLTYRRELLAIWREPVLRYPVMIIESDDWGAGPVEVQAAALNQLVDVLARYQDLAGHHPVMTLAVVLAVPDGPAIRRDGQYHRRLLDDTIFAPVRQAIDRGRAVGVFALQLHGLEHYWPASLMASTDPAVRSWLTGELPGTSEKLPAHLQSRWVDASVLPSRPLDPSTVEAAVKEEVSLYQCLFGETPRVAVPPTFVWTEDVERAWARAGVEFVVTPGLRSACRNARGLPDCDSGPFCNNQPGLGVTYLVRDDYFEPERNHRAERGLAALAHKWAQRRACLLETHRSNFIGDDASVALNLAEVDRLYALALERYPDLRFVSTEALGRVLQEGNPAWVETRFATRLGAWLARARGLSGYWRVARVTGLAWLMNLIAMPLRVGAR